MADFAQFRLQQIRAIENTLVLERDNVELKLKIEQMEKSNTEIKESKMKMVSLAKTVSSWLNKMREELIQTKSLCALQNAQLLSMNDTVLESVNEIADRFKNGSMDSNKLENQNSKLLSEVRELQKNLKTSQDEKQKANERAKLLGIELEESNLTKDLYSQNCSIMKEQIDNMTENLHEANNRYEVLSFSYFMFYGLCFVIVL